MNLTYTITTHWRAHLVGLRRSWHPHQGVSVLGDRGGWLVVRPSVQAATLGRAIALVGSVLDRGGRLWMVGGAPHPGRFPTPWGILWGEWVPGQLTNSTLYRARRALDPGPRSVNLKDHPGWGRPDLSQARPPLVRRLGWALHVTREGGWGVTWARSRPTRAGSTYRVRRWVAKDDPPPAFGRRWKVQARAAVRRRRQVSHEDYPVEAGMEELIQYQTLSEEFPTVFGAIAPTSRGTGLLGEADSIGAPLVLFYGAHFTPWATPWGVPWGGSTCSARGAARLWWGVHRRGWAVRTVRVVWGRVSGGPYPALNPFSDCKPGGKGLTGRGGPLIGVPTLIRSTSRKKVK